MFPMVAQAKRRRGIWPSRAGDVRCLSRPRRFQDLARRGRARLRRRRHRSNISTTSKCALPARRGGRQRTIAPGRPTFGAISTSCAAPLTMIVGEKRSTCPTGVLHMIVERRPEITRRDASATPATSCRWSFRRSSSARFARWRATQADRSGTTKFSRLARMSGGMSMALRFSKSIAIATASAVARQSPVSASNSQWHQE